MQVCKHKEGCSLQEKVIIMTFSTIGTNINFILLQAIQDQRQNQGGIITNGLPLSDQINTFV